MGTGWSKMASLTCLVLARLLAGGFGSPQDFLTRLAEVCSDCGLRILTAAKR